MSEYPRPDVVTRDYPFPWTMSERPNPQRGGVQTTSQCRIPFDDPHSEFRKWLSEFCDEVNGSACPPPWH